jgi:hypothetical protein
MRPRTALRYQDRISCHLYEHDEALVILRPGGGKTIAALTAIVDLREGEIGTPHHRAETSCTPWPDEIGEWAHSAGLRYAVLDGTPVQRHDMLATRPSATQLLWASTS